MSNIFRTFRFEFILRVFRHYIVNVIAFDLFEIVQIKIRLQ